MSYTKLKSDVTDWMHRTDLDGQMDTFTLLTEGVINKDLRVMEQETDFGFSFTDAYTVLPDDYLETRDIYVDLNGGRCSIENLAPQQLNARYSRATGRVRAYSIHGGQIEMRPAPDPTEPTTGSWTYIARVPSLTANATNDILENYPLLYLSGMMTQACMYVQDETETVKWSNIFDEQIRTANKSAGDGRYTRPQVRIV